MVGTADLNCAGRYCGSPLAGFYLRVSAMAAMRLFLGCFVDRQKNIFADRKFLNCEEIMVGTGRFELPTPRTPSECSTRLSHVPTIESRC
jgi:hypothetical protein